MEVNTMLSCFLALSLVGVIVGESIPALLWSPESSMSSFPDVSGTSALETDAFHGKYLAPLVSGPSAFVVFLQDKLHVDDFTKYADVYSLESDGGAFHNIKRLMDDNFSLEIPHVSDPHQAIEKLKSEFSGQVHVVNSMKEVEGLELKSTTPFLLMVHLNPFDIKQDQESVIRLNDETIGDVSRYLEKRSIKYSALFTGKHASDITPDEMESHNFRHLMADVDAGFSGNGTFMNASDGQIYIYMRDVTVCIKNGSSTCMLNFVVTPNANSANNSKSANGTASIELSFKNVKSNTTEVSSPYDIRIIMQAVNQKDRWNIQRTILYVTPTSGGAAGTSIENATLNPADMDFKIPIMYSFHCTDMTMKLETLYDKTYADYAGTYIRVRGFQVQPFNIQNKKFFNSMDCVGFFTTGIWMGLFPVAILLLILLYGFVMVLNLSIMDRYDDPKGRTITVQVGADQ